MAEVAIEAEALFKRSAEAEGWLVEEATPEQDYTDHIDFTIEWSRDPVTGVSGVVGTGARFTVDVKSHRSKVDDYWLEIRNVDGNAGWLYGKADYIAFQKEAGFLMVEREKLKNWVEENVSKEYVTDKKKALMRVYTRKGRKDMLTKVHGYWLVALADGRIPNA